MNKFIVRYETKKKFGLRMFELKMLNYKMIEDLKIKQRVQDELNEKFFVKIEN